MSSLLRNLRYTARTLWKNPGLTLTVLLTLALGIGANTAIFTVDYATLLAPMPYPQPDQLVVVWSKIQTFHNGISAGDFTDWKRENSTFQDINAFTGGSFNIASKDQPENIDGETGHAGLLQHVRPPLFPRPRLSARRRRRWQGSRRHSHPQTLGTPRLRSQTCRPIHANQRRALHRGRSPPPGPLRS